MKPARAKKTVPLEILGQSVAPGNSRRIWLKITESLLAEPISIPIVVMHGRRPGRRAFLTAAVHGNEINGVDIIRRVLASIEPERLRGILIAVPVANPQGFLARSRYLPDHRDLNRAFPGRARSNPAARIARAPHGGLLDLHVQPGDLVYAGDVVGVLRDPFGSPLNKPAQEIHSPMTGLVVGVANEPLVSPGAGIVHLTELKRALSKVERSLVEYADAWRETALRAA